MTDLINTIEAPGEFDALVKLAPGEPYFVLIGRDRSAPKLVDDWADANRRRAIVDHDEKRIDDAKLADELRQSTQAEMIGCAMRAFKSGHANDPVEQPRETKASYSGHRLDPASERRDAQQRVRSKAVSTIHNSIAELTEQFEALGLIGSATIADELGRVVETLRIIAVAVAPPRPGIPASVVELTHA